MNDRFSLEEQCKRSQKTDQLDSSGTTEEVLRAFWKPDDGNDGNSSGSSKYSRIMICSLVRGPEETISLETIEAEKS
jgi:hypothetical protein